MRWIPYEVDCNSIIEITFECGWPMWPFYLVTFLDGRYFFLPILYLRAMNFVMYVKGFLNKPLNLSVGLDKE